MNIGSFFNYTISQNNIVKELDHNITNLMESLFTLALKELADSYTKELNLIEENSITNGLILTNVIDVVEKLRGDIHLFYISYITHQYDNLFDLILNTHTSLVELQTIVYKPETIPLNISVTG